MAKLRRKAKISATILLCVLITYALVFTVFWKRSPRSFIATPTGPVEYVEFHYSPFVWKTDLLWTPAFWCVENCGYEFVAYAAAGEESIVIYAKQLTSASSMPTNQFMTNYVLPKRNIFAK
jgi:hypothetical protein